MKTEDCVHVAADIMSSREKVAWTAREVAMALISWTRELAKAASLPEAC